MVRAASCPPVKERLLFRLCMSKNTTKKVRPVVQTIAAVVVLIVTLTSLGFLCLALLTKEEDRRQNICLCSSRSCQTVTKRRAVMYIESFALAIIGPLTALLMTRATSAHLFHIALFATCAWAACLSGFASSLEALGYCIGDSLKP